MPPKRVLVGCEFSGTVRSEFRARGHRAFSCDVLPALDGPEFHFQCDVLEILNEGWDLGIFHPPCTYLTNSAEWAYADGPYHQKVKPGTLTGAARREAREGAVAFFMALYNCRIPRVAIENPTGHMNTRFRRPDQIIQPHQFGHDASKATCLWLRGLPLLKPTQHISPRMVNGKPRWANQTDSGQNKLSPSDDRWATRSLTYLGIAQAMADQWGFAIK